MQDLPEVTPPRQEEGDSELRTLLQGIQLPEAVEDDTVIWRYMDLPKFVAMLAAGGLWFAKASKLGDDPYEGFCEASNREFPRDEYGPGPVTAKGTVQISLQRFDAEMRYNAVEVCRNAREYLYVNSWCLASESMAMWQIYGSLGNGLAIRSTVGQYEKEASFGIPNSLTRFGRVEYLDDFTSSEAVRRDFSDGVIPVGSGLIETVLKLAFNKRRCYAYENEWRAAIYQDPEPSKEGDYVEFDLNHLINGVCVAPRAPAFFLDAVQAILGKFSLAKPLKRSPLLAPPPTKQNTFG